MIDKQKQIEEMEKDIAIRMAMAKGVAGSMNNGVEGWLSEYLYNAGYRKIPKLGVVLPFDHYDNLLKTDSQIRKETAEKFAERFKKKISSMIIELKANWATKEVEGFEKDVHELTCNCILNTLNTIKDFTVDKICKEITEGKLCEG